MSPFALLTPHIPVCARQTPRRPLCARLRPASVRVRHDWCVSLGLDAFSLPRRRFCLAFFTYIAVLGQGCTREVPLSREQCAVTHTNDA